jgi:formylglycine-generating enzyme required for sulfatase activity
MPLLRAAWLACCLLLAATCAAQTPARSALVFGNSNYPQAQLRNAVNDANDMARLLEGLGFKVTLITDGGRSAMLAGTETFMRKLGESEQVFVYYSGHGFQFGGQNYLIPTDALSGPQKELQARSIPLAMIMQRLAARRPVFSVVVLDACRENPATVAGGLAALDAPPNTLIAFATAPGKMASDGGGKNGLYTGHLLRHLGAPDTGIEDVFKRVRVGVLEESGGQQMPWENTSLTASLLMAPRAGGANPVASAAAMPEGWLAKASETQLRAYLARAPSAQTPAMRARTMDTLVALRARNRLRTGALALSEALCTGCPRMTPVAAKVPTWVGTDLVTRADYQLCVAARACPAPARQSEGPDSAPLQAVSFVAAQSYVRWLNGKGSGYLFRIPSWEDWEANYRSGYFDDKGKPLFGSALQCEVGNFYDASGAVTNQLPWSGAACTDGFAQAAPVGMFLPTREGLFDLVGNLWQWTTSCAPGGCGKYRLAGASWATGKSWPWEAPPQLSAEPDMQADLIGLRVYAARQP